MSDEEKWSAMCAKAKRLRNEGDLEGALELYRKALEITPSHEKLLNLINKIEGHLKTSRSSMVHLGEGFYLSKGIYDKLYNYQRNGVLFLYKLFRSRTGGILGDDMGLGKTVQVCSFLAGMFDSQRIKNTLVVVPPPLISNWENELAKWTPGLHIAKFHEVTKREKERVMDAVKRRGGVCLTSYNTFTTSADLLGEIRWDYCILDEGHKIKNHQTKTAKTLHGVKCPQRLILTGTPIMNSLKELWSLYDWTHQGQLLGTLKTFTEKFETPIVRARQKDATLEERRLGEAMSAQLNELISPFLLRRLKDAIKMENVSGDSESAEMPKLTKKNDLICWIRVSDDQEKVYKAFLTSDEVKSLLNTTRSPLVALTMLKKICDHPRLLSNQKCKMLGVSEGVDGLNEGSDDEGDELTFDIKFIPNHVLTKEAGKMSFLFGLLDRLREENHKCLVFSQSRRILDIIEKVISEKGFVYCRLDGRVRLMSERQEIIDKFQKKSKYQVFLLTTKVGGVGLTLTAANRVIIYDPSWNPSTDAQAVDRAFRIGQKQDVVIYRLITCGTVEEKIYRRQVYKDSICKKTLQDAKNPFRHFSKQDLFQLFELDNLEDSETQRNLSEMFRGKRNTNEELETHIDFLHTLDNFRGISDHDLLFTKDADDDDDVDTNAPQSSQYLDGYVSKAMERLNIESEENRMLSQQMGRYVGGGILEAKGKEANPSKKSSRDGEFPGNAVKSPVRRKYAVPSDDEDENSSHKGDDDDDEDSYNGGSGDRHHHHEDDDDGETRNSSNSSSGETVKLTNYSKKQDFKNVGSSSEEDENNDDDDDDEAGGLSRLQESKNSRLKAKSIKGSDDDDDGDDDSSYEEKNKSRLSKMSSRNNSIEMVQDTDDEDTEVTKDEDDIYVSDTDEEQNAERSLLSKAGSYAGKSKSRTSFARNSKSRNILGSLGNRHSTDRVHDDTRQSKSHSMLSSEEDDESESRKESDDEKEEEHSSQGEDAVERMSFEGETTADASKAGNFTGNVTASSAVADVSRVRKGDASGYTNADSDYEILDRTGVTAGTEESNAGAVEESEEEEHDESTDDEEEYDDKDDRDETQDNVDHANGTDEHHKSHHRNETKADHTSRTDDDVHESNDELFDNEDDEEADDDNDDDNDTHVSRLTGVDKTNKTYESGSSFDDDEENNETDDDDDEPDAQEEADVSYADRTDKTRKSIAMSENEDGSHDDEEEEDAEEDDELEAEEERLYNMYVDLIETAKDLCKKNELDKALDKFQEAFDMYGEEEQDPIIKMTIARLKEKLGR